VARGLSGPFRQLVAERPGHGLSVLVAPHDPEFPHLVALSDPGHAAGVLGTGAASVVPVRYRPGERHVLRWQAGNDAPLFVKLYQDGESEAAEALATRLAAWFSGEGGEIRAVAPSFRLPADDAIVYPFVAGRQLSAGVAAGQRSAAAWLETLGAVLARLHQAEPPVAGLEPITMASEVKAVRRAAETVDALLPEAASVLHRLLDRLLAAGAGGGPVGFVHGDLKCDHLIATAAQVHLIDFDSCRTGDPAVDLGKLLADIRWWARAPTAREAAAGALVRGYGGSAEVLTRASCWEALIFAKIVLRRVRIHERDWAPRTTALLDEAAALGNNGL
jgi:Ser/Thr protein kinase RdoA (MazF antagonist)